MDGMVTHIVTRECLIAQPHQAMECGVVAARQRCQEEGDSAMRRQHEDEQDDAVIVVTKQAATAPRLFRR
jgi:hypothetical protein